MSQWLNEWMEPCGRYWRWKFGGEEQVGLQDLDSPHLPEKEERAHLEVGVSERSINIKIPSSKTQPGMHLQPHLWAFKGGGPLTPEDFLAS